MNLAKNIKSLRQNNHLTQDEFGHLFGVTRSTVSKWERGISEPSLELIKMMSTFFNVSVDELTGHSEKELNNYSYDLEAAKRSISNINILSNNNRIIFIVPIINIVLLLLIITSLLVVLVNAHIDYNNQESNMKLIYSNIESVSLNIYYPDGYIEDIKFLNSKLKEEFTLNNIEINTSNLKDEKAFRTNFSIMVEFKSGHFSDLSRTKQLDTKKTSAYILFFENDIYPYFIQSGTYSFKFYVANEMGYLEAFLS